MKSLIDQLNRSVMKYLGLSWNIDTLIILKESVVLRSIPKSGTNYLRMLLANYLCNLDSFEKNAGSDARFKRISYDEMTEIFPNVRAYIFTRKATYQRPREDSAPAFFKKYRDFVYDHGVFLDKYRIFSAKKTICLYRNPLDQMVSKYYYFFKNRIGKEQLYSHPKELVGSFLPSYIKSYTLMMKLASQSNAMMITYEDLIQEPEESLHNILKFLELPVFPILTKYVIQAAGRDEIKKEERQRGGAIHTPVVGQHGSFVRSGRIGEWQDFFTNIDVERIQSRFRKYGIDLMTEFQVLPK